MMNVRPGIRAALVLTAAVATLFASASIHSAHADEILFSIAGTGGDPDATFELPENPRPDSSNPGGSFTFDSLPAIVGGTPVHLMDLTFFSSAGLGGLRDDIHYNLLGAQLYTNTESNPTFVPGVYQLTGFTGDVDIVTLTAVPEPTTWALLLIGLAGLGFARRCKRKPAQAPAPPSKISHLPALAL